MASTPDPVWSLITVVVDKGLFALLLLLAGWVASRSLERLKSSLAWGAEVLKQKLLLAKDALAAIREMSDAHLQFVGSVAIGALRPETQDRFFKACRRIEEVGQDARLLLSQSTVEAIENVRDAAMRCITPGESAAKVLSGSGARLREEEGKATLLGFTPEVRSAQEAERKRLKAAIDAAVTALQTEFPSGTHPSP